MERRLKYWGSPEFRGSMHPVSHSSFFFHIFSRAREKIGPPEARQKRPRRNESLQARLLILCARFFLSKPQTEFAVWVLSQICDNLSVSAAPSQHPYPFCPFGTFPPDRGNRPLGGEPFLLRRDMKNPRFRVETGGGLMEIKLLPLPSWRLR